MATVTPGPGTFNVRVQQVSDTKSSGLGTSTNSPQSDTAHSSPGKPLTVDIRVKNSHGGANTVTAQVTDPSGSGGFFGEGSLTWDDGDDSEVWIEFTDFPLRADQVTATDSCGYSVNASGDAVAVTEFTL
ncbi:hypothetical protein ACH4TE_06120 [Streptomyces sioyaensis]|uniref:hypothetical protein n=1 Tax=Streptomyces sioyaensis TaxID=67364 RepID=UPI0037BBEA09